MMMIDRTIHIIRRQKLDVSFRDGRKGLGLPHELSLLFRERIAPLLDIVLEEMDRPGYFIRLDQLTLDVGSLPSKGWDRLLPERVVKLFREELQRQLRLVARSDREELEEGEQGWEDGPRAAWHSLLCFLATGALTGWGGLTTLPALEERVLETLCLPHPSTWRLRLARQLAEEPVFLERFLLQLTPSFHESLLEWMGYGDQRISIDISGSVQLDPVMRGRLETLLRLWQGLSLQEPMQLYYLDAPGVVLEKMIAGHRDPTLERELRRLLPKGTVMLRDPEERRRSLPGAELSEEDGIYIGNAGLVLLHPFLSSFMSELGLADNAGRWHDPVSQERGCWLTQYLVGGQTELEEPDIVLNKLLCGYPVDQPVERYWEPSATEQAETQRLLEQVITYWTALKNTSVEGLRANFLQRAGKLQRRGDVWLLQVEQKTWDVLLGMLPWGIGQIKNQWMEERLVVEWA